MPLSELVGKYDVCPVAQEVFSSWSVPLDTACRPILIPPPIAATTSSRSFWPHKTQDDEVFLDWLCVLLSIFTHMPSRGIGRWRNCVVPEAVQEAQKACHLEWRWYRVSA